MQIYIWRNTLDPDDFSIGVKYSDKKYGAWTHCFIDGIEEMFSKDIATECIKMSDSMLVKLEILKSTMTLVKKPER